MTDRNQSLFGAGFWIGTINGLIWAYLIGQVIH